MSRTDTNLKSPVIQTHEDAPLPTAKETYVTCEGAENGMFTLAEAIEGVEMSVLGGSENVNSQNVNILKIMLGIALSSQNQTLFDKVVRKLGIKIDPFSDDFDQGRGAFNIRVKKLLNLTLKAAIVANNDLLVR